MKITIKCEPQEIAALILAIQEQREEVNIDLIIHELANIMTDYADRDVDYGI